MKPICQKCKTDIEDSWNYCPSCGKLQWNSEKDMTNNTTPPVNESWEDIYWKMWNRQFTEDKKPLDYHELKKLIQTAVSTARQEALSEARELVAKDRPMFIKNNIVSLIDSDHAIKIRKQLRKEILQDIDSLTSKGGV